MSGSVPTEKLTQIFNKTTTSYKYLWFLSILNFIDDGDTRQLKIDELIFEMLKISWYPVNYYRFSFGVQDKICEKVQQCQHILNLDPKSKGEEILTSLKENRSSPEISSIVDSLKKYAPYRLLTPWFVDELKNLPDAQKNSAIEKLAAKRFSLGETKSLYKFDGQEGIEIDPNWFDYLKRNSEVLRGFTLWNFMKHLQKLNPDVPGITEKLFEKRQ